MKRRMNMRRTLPALLLPLVMLTSPLALAFDITPFTATYRFNLDNKLSGSATRVLEKQQDGSWLYTFTASAPMANATESSHFRYDGSSVTPLHYEQNRKIFMVKKGASIAFDWKALTGAGRRDGKKPVDYKLQKGALDTLSMEIQLRRDLKDLGKLASPYWIATPKEISEQAFVVEGEETITTPMGKIATLKVSRKHNDPDRHTTFWLAKDYDFLPAKVTQKNDGALYIIELSKYEKAGTGK